MVKSGRKEVKFCKRGHEISVVGRDACGRCRVCSKLTQRIDLEKDSRRKQFCPKGHNTFIVGRNIYNTCCNECQNENEKNWKIENKEIITTYNKAFSATRLKTDTNFKLRHYLRTRITKAIKNNWKIGSAVHDLGCSVEFLKQYIESKFYDGMTWNNWGKVWQLDHIKELHTFDLTDRKQFLEVCHYTNLQPLTIEDHRNKSNMHKKDFLCH